MASKDQIDQATRHQIMVQRYAKQLERNSAEFVDRATAAVSAILSNEQLESLSASKLKALNKQVNRTVQSIYAEMGGQITDQIGLFADYESDFTAAMLSDNATATIAAASALRIRELSESLIDLAPGQQMSIREALSQFGEAKSRDMVSLIRDSHLAGDTSQVVSRKIADMAPLHKAQAGSLTRTIVNRVSTIARDEVFAANADILEGVEWVSTLDSRTSLTCMGLDGKVFPIGEGPRPPAHWSCRSTVVAKVKPEYDALPGSGNRPSVGPSGAEQVSGSTTYGQWLKRQPAAFQDEVLGAKRAALFRRGGLDIGAFTDRGGQAYTLDDLKRLQPLAFEKANI